MLHRLAAPPAPGRQGRAPGRPRLFLVCLLTLSFLVGAAPAQAAPCPPGTVCRRVYLPLVSKPATCPAMSVATFAAIPILYYPTGGSAAQNPDLNLGFRGYQPTNAPLQLVDYGGSTDPNAPQMRGLFANHRTPVFTAAYQVHDWPCNATGCTGLVTTWPVTLLGMGTTVGEPISIPSRSPQIYPGGYVAMVLYAEERRITLEYTQEDTPAVGYTVHIENVCVDPNLLRLYNDMNAAGRWKLPALQNGQALGTAAGGSIAVAIRDTGSFMDPRTLKDWWQY